MKRALFDLEGNGLLSDVTKIHCIAATDVDTKQPIGTWGPDQIPQALDALSQADKLIAHFGLGYDFPALEKVVGFKVPFQKQVDSVVLARLRFPNIKELDSKFNATMLKTGSPMMGDKFGKHSIAAWGIRLGLPKLHDDIEDWSQWTPQMQERCVGDVATTLKAWEYFRPDELPQAAVELEHRIARVCLKMTEAGWPFNEEKAHELHAKLIEEKAKIEAELKAQFGSWTEDDWFTPKVNNEKRGYVKGVPYNRQSTIQFNPNSRPHIERCLRELGWRPSEFTESGQARLDEEVIESLAAEFPQAQGLSRYLMIGKRLGQLADGKQAWLSNVKDGKIHAEYNPIGAVTMRASHFNPNIAQVPSSSSEFGHECRELFCVPAGWSQVGADMAGLEGRCFAHYLAKYDSGAYGRTLLEGDPHWAIVCAVGFLEQGTNRDKSNAVHEVVRNGAKRLFYAMLYGAGNKKLQTVITDTVRAATAADPSYEYRDFKHMNVRRRVMGGIAGFTDLQRVLSHYVEQGALPGLDLRRIPIRSEHSALNTLLQSAGAILCKQWVCDSYDKILDAGYRWGWDGDFVFLGWIHDEVQIACRKEIAEHVGKIVTAAARAAGQPFKFRIALDSEFKIGSSWKDTH